MTKRAAAVVTAALSVTVAAGGAVAMTAGAQGADASVSRATLTVHKTRFGKVIFDGHGRVLYLFGRDRTSKSTCYGSCAKAWPPFLTRGTPRAGAGARKGLIGITRRKDGSLQVTYGGHPLYYYEGDRRGQVNCQGVNNAGGIWLVVSPNGKAVR